MTKTYLFKKARRFASLMGTEYIEAYEAEYKQFLRDVEDAREAGMISEGEYDALLGF